MWLAWRIGEFALALAFALLAYLATATVLAGSALRPLIFLLYVTAIPPNRLGPAMSSWAIVWTAASLASALTIYLLLRLSGSEPFRHLLVKPAVYVAGTMIVATLLVGVGATTIRRIAILNLAPDRIQSETFLYSLRVAGEGGWVFPPHAVAVKDCHAYVWSWRHMRFDPVHVERAKTALPRAWDAEWRATCSPAAAASGRAG